MGELSDVDPLHQASGLHSPGGTGLVDRTAIDALERLVLELRSIEQQLAAVVPLIGKTMDAFTIVRFDLERVVADVKKISKGE